MKLVALLHTTDFRGDHSADVVHAFEVDLQQPVGELFERIHGSLTRPSAAYIELRIVSPVGADAVATWRHA